MNNLVVVLLVCCIFCCTAYAVTLKNFIDGSPANIKSKCLKQNEMSEGQLEKLINDSPPQLPENELCFLKCFGEETRFLKKNGEVNVPIFQQFPGVKKMPKQRRQEMVACLRRTGKITSCKDMSKVRQCFA